MRIRRVNRYYCDFCKKANCSGASIKNHEERCTMNPNRVCGMCKMLDNEQPSMPALLDSLPDLASLMRTYEGEGCGYQYIIELDRAAVQRLRDVADNCPACMMAALRQKKIPVCNAVDFDFTKECKSIWSDINHPLHEPPNLGVSIYR